MLTATTLFTLDEARRTLPLIKRIAADVQATVSDLSKITGGIAMLLGALDSEDIPAASQARALALLDDFQALSEEIAEIGAELKGIDPVLVDFRSLRGGREVYLCWSLGEEDITHWHTLDGGFRARQEL